VKNVVLLGGEPTLKPNLEKIIEALSCLGICVYVTTNGSLLDSEYVAAVLRHATGVNISIHDYDMGRNQDITGILLKTDVLRGAIGAMHCHGIKVRLNCNCIKGFTDDYSRMRAYVVFARWLGADSIRFAELKHSVQFVDLAEIFYKLLPVGYDPYVDGCSIDTRIDNFPVNLRLMCGMQTRFRKMPKNPEQITSDVLYYDGLFYSGWQKEGAYMDDKDLVSLLRDVHNQKISVAEAALKIGREMKTATPTPGHEPRKGDIPPGGGCRY